MKQRRRIYYSAAKSSKKTTRQQGGLKFTFDVHLGDADSSPLQFHCAPEFMARVRASQFD
jgi:hypothetical protein